MSKIVIKKRVELDFLGEEYKGAYLIFRSLPLSDYDQIEKELPESNSRYIKLIQKASTTELTEQEEEEFIELQKGERVNNQKYLAMIIEYMKRYFLSGEFPNVETGKLETLSTDDLEGLDRDTATKCFRAFTGQEIDPKE